MQSGYTHSGLGSTFGFGASDNAAGSKSESGGISAAKVIGNRLKMKKDTTVHLGYIGSPNTKVWPKGYLSPPVDTWVTDDNGNVYWSFGELKPIRYVKHKPGQFKLIRDYSGPSLNNSSGSSWLDFLDGGQKGGLLGSVNKTLSKVIIIAGAGAGIYFLSPLFPEIRDGFEHLADKLTPDKK
jgi:hypothetical protein